MALRDVLEEYSHTRIDERYINNSCYQILNIIILCSKLPWPISKIRDVVKKYEVTYYSQFKILYCRMPSETYYFMQYYYRSLCEHEVNMVYWRIAAKRLSESHLGKCMKDSEIKSMACGWPLTTLCPPLVSHHVFPHL